MSNDPFAGLEPDNTNNTNTDSKEETIMNDGKIVITLKAGSGYDAPWIVVHASDVNEAGTILSDENFDALMAKTAERAQGFAGNMPQKPARGGAVPQGKPAGANTPPNGATPPEGYEYRSGVGKTGRPWQAFMPIDRNAGLDPIWLDAQGNPRK